MSSKHYNRNDYKAMSQVLQSVGITKYGKNVLPLMIEFARNYVRSVLDEAHELATTSNKMTFDNIDVQDAIKIQRDKLYHKVPLPKEAVLGTSLKLGGKVKEPKHSSTPSVIDIDSNSESSVIEGPSTFDRDDCEQYCLNYTDELSAICNRVSADASPMQKIIKNPKNKSHYKRSPAKKETVSSHQSNEINKPEPSPASDIIQIDDDSPSPVPKQPSTSFVEEYLHFLLNESTESAPNCNEKSSDISSVPTTTETERDKLSGQRTNSPSSVTQVPSTSSIDDCIESVVNEANEFTSKFSEKNSDIVNARKTTKKQRVKLSNKVSLAKKDVTRITSGSSTGIEKEKPSPTSSITKDSNSQDLFTSGSSTYYVEDYVHAFLTDTNEPSTSPNRMTFTISGKQRVIKNKKQKLDTQKSPEREGLPTTSSKPSAEKSVPTSLSPSSKIKKESPAQSPVKTQPSTSYGKSIVKLLEMFKADESPKKGVKRNVEEDDEQSLSSKDKINSPIIVRVNKQEVYDEDDDYDETS